MTRRARVWMGATLLTIILFNYLAIGIPLYKRMSSLDNKVRIFTKNSEDLYLTDVLKREMLAVDKKIVILNCAGATMTIIIVSWIIFGLVIHKPDRQRGKV
jgi:hypothetical protein